MEELLENFIEDSKVELNKRVKKEINELLYSCSELGLFDEGSISERSAMMIISFYFASLENKVTEDLFM